MSRLRIAYGILLVCWGLGNPPFAAPDEWSHYLRALGIGRLIGEPSVYVNKDWIDPRSSSIIVRASRSPSSDRG